MHFKKYYNVGGGDYEVIAIVKIRIWYNKQMNKSEEFLRLLLQSKNFYLKFLGDFEKIYQ